MGHFAAHLKDRCVPIDYQWLGHYVRRGHELGALPLRLLHHSGHFASGGVAGAQWKQRIPARSRICLLHCLGYTTVLTAADYELPAPLQIGQRFSITHKLIFYLFFSF